MTSADAPASPSPIKVLLVEDNPPDAHYVKTTLTYGNPDCFMIHHAKSLKEALALVHQCSPDVVLLDLSLPDSLGLATFKSFKAGSGQVPIVILSGLGDEKVAMDAIRLGAQDYLVKGRYDGTLLCHALQYSIQRSHILQTLERLALLDETTGLFNHQGFQLLGQKQIEYSVRKKQKLVLFLIEHKLGAFPGADKDSGTEEHHLRKFAQILKFTFRQMDIFARLSDRRFAVLAIESGDEQIGEITGRLVRNWKTNWPDSYFPDQTLTIGSCRLLPGEMMDLAGMIRVAESDFLK